MASIQTPEHWVRGQLLDVRRFCDATGRTAFFRIALAHESEKERKSIEIHDAREAQDFIAWWYAPANFRKHEAA